MIDAKRIVIPSARSVRLEEIGLPSISPQTFLAEALLTGISAGTERMWYNGSNPALKSGRRGYPYFPGYEFVGRVVEVGNSVANVRAGDIVWAMLPHASHAIVDGKRPYVIAPSDIDPQEGLFVALTSTAIHTLRRGNLELGDDVAVIGLGVLGLLIVQVAKAAGARRVIAINPSHWKLELARRLGADLTLTTQDANWQKTLLEATDGRGTDVSIDCSGTGEGVMAAIDAVRKRGRVLVAGFHTEPFAISGEDLFAKELAIFGVRSTGGPDYSYEYTRWNQNSNYQEAAHLLFTGRVRGCDLITHRIAATDAELAYRLIDRKSESFLQIVLDWTLKQ